MREELERKVRNAIRLIRSVSSGVVEVAYSGGKDSDVILQLVKESGVNFRAIYKNTTIDPPGTLKHVRDNNVEIHQPKETFFNLIKQNGLPSRYKRFCCEKLKEYKILDIVILGISKCESVHRSNNYQEPTKCRIYSKKKYSQHIYPILDWTNEDVEEFIEDRNIKVNPLYYDDNGKLDVKRRLGCMCCPMMYYKKRIEEFKKRPNGSSIPKVIKGIQAEA